MKITIKGTPEEIAEVAKEMQLQLEGDELPKKIFWHVDMREVDAGFRKFLQDTAKSIHAKADAAIEARSFFQSPPLSRERWKHNLQTSCEATSQPNDSD